MSVRIITPPRACVTLDGGNQANVRLLPRRRRGLALDRTTRALGGVAIAATAATVAVEVGRVWRRGSAPLPSETDDLLEAAGTATLETIAVIREGYRTSSRRENAVFNMAAAFALTFALTRGATTLIRSGRRLIVLGNLVVGDRHIHHFVPGIALSLGAGGIAIAVRTKEIDRWLALPFGAGAALVLDEAALLFELEDVYWTEEGVLSLQLSFAALATLASLAIAIRLFRRGESTVLPADG
jgi:hypothetical protein